MRLVLQRVTSAKVVVDGVTVGEIGKGLLVLGGICDSDDEKAAEWAARKILGTRLWEDAAGKHWARSVQQEGLEVLLVSQFTLHGKPLHSPATAALSRQRLSACVCRDAAVLKGNKPDFHHAMPPARSRPFWEKFVASMEKKLPGKVQQGQFGALMQVHLVNDGPVTITLDSEANASAPAPAPAPQPPAPPPTPPPAAEESLEAKATRRVQERAAHYKASAFTLRDVLDELSRELGSDVRAAGLKELVKQLLTDALDALDALENELPPPSSPAAPARIGIAVAAAVVVLGLLHHARKAFRS